MNYSMNKVYLEKERHQNLYSSKKYGAGVKTFVGDPQEKNEKHTVKAFIALCSLFPLLLFFVLNFALQISLYLNPLLEMDHRSKIAFALIDALSIVFMILALMLLTKEHILNPVSRPCQFAVHLMVFVPISCSVTITLFTLFSDSDPSSQRLIVGMISSALTLIMMAVSLVSSFLCDSKKRREKEQN
jgi:hypothetical protein